MIWKTSFTQTAQIRLLLTLTCQMMMTTSDSIWKLYHLQKILIPKRSKFAVECDWISKNSQNVQNWVCWKNWWVFRAKNLNSNFSKIAKCCNFAVDGVLNNLFSCKCFFHLNCEIFLAKSQIFFKLGRIRKHVEERECSILAESIKNELSSTFKF